MIHEETKKLDEYKDRIGEIKQSLLNKTIPYRKRKELEEENCVLEKKIHDLETNNMFAEYICISQKIIAEYMQLLMIPMNISFFSKKKDISENVSENKKENLLEKFLDIAKKYIPIKTYK